MRKAWEGMLVVGVSIEVATLLGFREGGMC